jgi:acetyltransferase-like isoleucine patch superfamily enzyme
VVGEAAWVGIGTVVREGISIGPRCVIGAGSAVVDDQPPDKVAYGNPCRPVRQIGEKR